MKTGQKRKLVVSKSSKIDKPLARMTKKKMEKVQINNMRNERGFILVILQ